MSAIKKVENLKDSHIKFILACLSRTSDFHQIKQKFQEFFETGIPGEVIIQVAEDHKEKIIELKDALPFDEKAKDVPFADPIVQIQLLADLYKDCLVSRVVNITRDGALIEKVDHPTALRCIEAAAKIRSGEKDRELKKYMLEITPDNTQPATNIESTGSPGGFSVKVIHSREED